MKKFSVGLFIFIGTMFSHSVSSQSTDSLSFADLEFRKYSTIYQLANDFNDPDVARMALYNILIYTGNKGAILDSLAMIYYSNRQYVSAALVAKEGVRMNPDSELALEIAAVSFASLGAKDQSVEYYEKLFLKNDQSSTIYQAAFLQYELKRFTEAKASIGILLGRQDVDETKLVFTKLDDRSQEVTIRAAVLNLKGLVSLEEGDKEKAKTLFLEALNASAGFEQAQINLRDASK